MSGCVLPKPYENAALLDKYEREFAHRELADIEGFWRQQNEWGDFTAAIARVDASKHDGFAFAAWPVSSVERTRVLASYRNVLYDLYDHGRYGRFNCWWRFNPSNETGVYHGQVVLVRAGKAFWRDATLALVDATTLQLTLHVEFPILGGSTQRLYADGPAAALEARRAAAARSKPRDGPAGVGGSGFLVAPSLVVTNHHVVKSAGTIQCFIGADSISAHAVASDQDNDLALLKLEREAPASAPILKIGEASAVKQGARVYAFGYPLTDVLGTNVSVHEGVISGLSGYQGRSAQFQVEMPVHPGSSGGPLTDVRGAVVGVVTGKLGLGYLLKTGDVPQGITFAVKSDLIRPLAAAAGLADELSVPATDAPSLTLEQVTELYSGAVVRIEAQR